MSNFEWDKREQWLKLSTLAFKVSLELHAGQNLENGIPSMYGITEIKRKKSTTAIIQKVEYKPKLVEAQ